MDSFKLFINQSLIILILIVSIAVLTLVTFILPLELANYEKDLYLLVIKTISFLFVFKMILKINFLHLISNDKFNRIDALKILLLAVTYSVLFNYYVVNFIIGENMIMNKDSIIKSIELFFVAPLLEEILFRGIIQKRFNQELNYFLSIMLTSILFSLYHANYQYLFSHLAFSIVVGLIYQKYNSLLLCVFFHSLINIGIFTIYSL